MASRVPALSRSSAPATRGAAAAAILSTGDPGARREGSVFFFDLQVGQAANGLGRQCGVRRPLQKALIVQHRLLKSAFDLLFLDLDTLMAQIGDGTLVADRCA